MNGTNGRESRDRSRTSRESRSGDDALLPASLAPGDRAGHQPRHQNPAAGGTQRVYLRSFVATAATIAPALPPSGMASSARVAFEPSHKTASQRRARQRGRTAAIASSRSAARGTIANESTAPGFDRDPRDQAERSADVQPGAPGAHRHCGPPKKTISRASGGDDRADRINHASAKSMRISHYNDSSRSCEKWNLPNGSLV